MCTKKGWYNLFDPGMMKNMMSSMCKSMMGNQQMMDIMQKMKGKNMDMEKMDKKTENK